MYAQDQTRIHLKYLDPQFSWPEAEADAGTPMPGSILSAEEELPWIEEIREVVPETDMWAQVETEMVRHLYNALRNKIPFPVTSRDALEVVRITEIVKKQNPQFVWIG